MYFEDSDQNDIENDMATLQISAKSGNDWWHDIIITSKSRQYWRFEQCENYVKIIEKCLAEDDDRNLNKLDSRGETALHAAVWNRYGRNYAAVDALLACGADINVLNIKGRTPPTCIEIREHHPYLITIHRHIEMLIAFGMYVRDLNMQWYCESLEYDDVCVGKVDHDYIEKWRPTIIKRLSRRLEFCSKSIEKMKNIKINERTTLYRVFCDGAEQLAYSPIKLRELEKIVNAEGFYEEFGFRCGLGGLLKLVYRRACSRRKLLPDVENALQVLFIVELPSPCIEAVVKNLNDFELADVVEAVNFKQD